VTRVRLTGGEPLLRDDLPEIARGISRLPGLREVCLTTNGHRLEALAPELVAAGVSSVNVSLDAVDAEAFRALTKNGDVERVKRGIEAAARAGFRRVGLNAVVIAHRNDSPSSLARLARFAWDHSATPRFIELMPFAGLEGLVPNGEVRRRILEEGIVCEPVGPREGAGPASYFRAIDRGRDAGDIGFVGAMTENFCTRCNRARISATGELRACLGGREQVPLAPMMRAGASDDELRAAIRGALLAKWDGHRFVEEGAAGLLTMMGIGG
jgi:cyclic pyranopterin phosphate synthase